jgi:Carboxypeptidase regulatory-like domain
MKLVCLFAALVAYAAPLFGQAANGTITGTVTDPAGAVVPNAPVDVQNTGTGVTYSTVTTRTGDYTVAQLPVGPHQVTIQAPGFYFLVRSLAVAARNQALVARYSR